MTSKLDQSLDEILAERPRGPRRGGKGGASNAPAGGIRKRSQRVAAHKANVAVTQNTSKASGNVPTGPSGKVTASKIIVSNLVSHFIFLIHFYTACFSRRPLILFRIALRCF